MKKFLISLSVAVLGLSIAVGASISPYTASAATVVNNNYTTVNTAGSGIVLEPTMVFEPKSLAEIEELKLQVVRPASIVLTPDKEMQVSFEEGAGKSLRQVIEGTLGALFIPVVRLTKDTVTAFIDYMTNAYTKLDIMAISSDIEVIQKLYADKVTYIVNTVYDLTDVSIPADRYGTWQYVGAANAAGCNVLMFDAADPNLPVAAEYISAMTKSCWAYSDNKLESVAAISAGCYGVVSGDFSGLKDALAIFNKDGFTRAQYVAAHRGITAYCNENSLTAVAAAASEGATHVELDIEITADGKLLMCHDPGTSRVANGNMYFSLAQYNDLRRLTLRDYTDRYVETFPSLEEVFECLSKTDVIVIIELKFDNCTTKALKELEAIKTLKKVADQYPEMAGHWITISFYGPYAEGMKEYIPEVPCCGLGGAQSGYEKDQGITAWNGKWVSTGSDFMKRIDYMRTYNVGFDEMHYADLIINRTAANFLARGYAQNSWTYKNVKHFDWKINIATTDAAEQCSMFVKNILTDGIKLTAKDLAAGKMTVPCQTYSGWIEEKECEIITVEQSGTKTSFMLYYKQEASYMQEEDGYTVPKGETGDASYGLYSKLVTLPLS